MGFTLSEEKLVFFLEANKSCRCCRCCEDAKNTPKKSVLARGEQPREIKKMHAIRNAPAVKTCSVYHKSPLTQWMIIYLIYKQVTGIHVF